MERHTTFRIVLYQYDDTTISDLEGRISGKRGGSRTPLGLYPVHGLSRAWGLEVIEDLCTGFLFISGCLLCGTWGLCPRLGFRVGVRLKVASSLWPGGEEFEACSGVVGGEDLCTELGFKTTEGKREI